VRPGNSGGPVVDQTGRFVGVVFASSVSDPRQAFAVTADEVVPAIREAMAGPRSIDTRRLACVR
jgi:S1-C subfamily serine protease